MKAYRKEGENIARKIIIKQKSPKSFFSIISHDKVTGNKISRGKQIRKSKS